MDGLLVDGLVAPRGLHAAAPRLSWRVVSGRGARQTVWHVGVASTRAGAASGRYDIWDSGRTDGAKCFDIAYAGVPLVSRQQLFWRVTAWDERGTPATGPVGSWEMGLLRPSDWDATWLTAETAVDRADRDAGLRWYVGDGSATGTTHAFRLGFDLSEAAEVVVMSAADTRPQVFVNDRLIVDPASNGWGTPGPFVNTLALSAGRHVVALEIRRRDTDPVTAAALVRATLPDGRILRFDDSRPRVAAAPASGWKQPDFEDHQWKAATVADGVSPMPAHPATLLRRTFAVNGRIASARPYVTALGAFEAELNGQLVGDALASITAPGGHNRGGVRPAFVRIRAGRRRSPLRLPAVRWSRRSSRRSGGRRRSGRQISLPLPMAQAWSTSDRISPAGHVSPSRDGRGRR